MSRIAILGASGHLGDLLLTEALDAGWLVSALARDPGRIRKANERLTLFQGDADRGQGLEAAVTGCRYIIYAVDSSRPSESVAHLVQAVGWKVVERIILVSRLEATGAGGRRTRGLRILRKLLPKPARRVLFGDVSHAEQLLRVSGLPYCIFRVVELTDEPHGQEVVVAEATEPPPGPVGRADLARFVIRSLGDRSWNLREVTVGAKQRSS